jgi:putative intracellular protease/amidase
MTGGLEGRRIALVAPADAESGRAQVVRSALAQSGAQIDLLTPGQGADEEWHGGRYAALVAIGHTGPDSSTADDPRLQQLVREFLVSEKPVAAIGSAVGTIIRSGGAAGRTLSADSEARQELGAAGGKASQNTLYADGCLVTASGDSDDAAFAAQVVRSFAAHLEERDVDAMSDQSFPASDPPATTPVSVGHVAPERDPGTA